MARIGTGFPTADAQDDFTRARRRQVMSRLARRLSREPGDIDVILPFDETVAALGRLEERYVGLRMIELDSIVGTVDRTTGFDRQQCDMIFARLNWHGLFTASITSDDVVDGRPSPFMLFHAMEAAHA